MQKTEKADLNSVFNNRLLIPDYQRAYSWKTKQVRQFFEDLEYAVTNNFEESTEKYHYFGTVVFEDKQRKYTNGGYSVKEYDIVDGQQRLITVSIFARVLIDIITTMEENKRLDTTKINTTEIKKDIKELFINKSGMDRLEPEDISKDAYKTIVIHGETKSSYDTLAGRNIQQAYNTLYDKTIQYLNTNSDDSSEHINQPLLKLIRTIKSEFLLTPNILTDMNEASRMFKIINDRGKDLLPMDKIKSHLMYCCTFLDDFKPEQVSRLINQSIQKITEIPQSKEHHIQEFAKIHWYLFTGEGSDDWNKSVSKYNFEARPNMKYFERLQEIPFYASTSRDKKSLRSFVGHYVKSMSKIVDSYITYKYPTYSLKNNLIDAETANYLYTIHQASNTFGNAVYITGSFYGLNTSRQKTALELAIRPAIRYNLIMKRAGSFSRLLRSHGHKLFWLTYSGDITNKDLFGNRTHSMYDIPNSQTKWIQETENKIQTKLSKRCSDETVSKFLHEQDVLNGEFTDGWTGFRSLKTAKILLYYYENSLRTENLNNHITLKKWCENLHLEHILPSKPKENEKIPYHNKNINKLGNLLMLTPKLNTQAQNNNYTTKIQNYYPESYNSVEMIRELPPNKWTANTINDRTTKITNALLEQF